MNERGEVREKAIVCPLLYIYDLGLEILRLYIKDIGSILPSNQVEFNIYMNEIGFSLI
jgi:hypothetical protein